MSSHKTWVVIPAHNEEKTISTVISEVLILAVCKNFALIFLASALAEVRSD